MWLLFKLFYSLKKLDLLLTKIPELNGRFYLFNDVCSVISKEGAFYGDISLFLVKNELLLALEIFETFDKTFLFVTFYSFM